MNWQVQVNNQSGMPVVAPGANAVLNTSALIFTRFGTISLVDIGHQVGGPHYWAIQVTSGKNFSQVFWYDGGGLVALAINADGSFSATGQGNNLVGKIGGPPGRTFQLPASRRVYITGVTNAALQQRVTLTLGGMGPSYVWTGAGEGNHELMNQFVDTTSDPSGQIQAGVLMENDQGGNWFPNNMSPLGAYQLMGFNVRFVVSEDGADQDYNDSAMQMQWWALPAH